MIIVRLEGGLGNQMFQYALGKAVAKKHNTSLRLDTTFLLDRTLKNTVFRNYDLDILNLEVKIAQQEDIEQVLTAVPEYSLSEKIKFRFLKSTIPYFRKNEFYEKQFYAFDPNVFNTQKNVYFYGYWQNQHYFNHIKDELQKDFSFRNPLSENENTLLSEINSENAVAINVRRTDYISDQETNEFMGVITGSYYPEAIKIVKQKISKPRFYIFSDDIEWCREHFKDLENHVIVDHSYKGHKFSSYLRLMSSCKHFIIPNSTFAWWAVWINQNNNKVIVQPKNWVNDKSKDTSGLIFKGSFLI